MNVKELRKALEQYPDDMELMCGELGSAYAIPFDTGLEIVSTDFKGKWSQNGENKVIRCWGIELLP